MIYLKSITLRPCSGAGPRDSNSRPRIYITPEGETIRENFLHGRHNRPYTLYKKEVLPQLFRKLGLNPETVSWSQKAGCSCPCSPGFIVRSWDIPYDIHVTVTDQYVAQTKINGSI